MTIEVDGTVLTCADVRAVAHNQAKVVVGASGLARARAAHDLVTAALAGGIAVYGRTTGVGANRSVVADQASHGTRLLHSHAVTAGEQVDDASTRAALVVRLNQLAAGGSGVEPELLVTLADALNDGRYRRPRRFGGIGTGDLGALATLALDLPVAQSDALALISSNAVTIGTAALCCHKLHILLDATLVVAALSAVAVGASTEPFARAVHQARPHPGQRAAADRMRALLGPSRPRARRIQDPYGYRTLPQVHGPALDAARHLHRVLWVELNAAAENPLVDTASGTVIHNGNFHAQYLALALDAVRAALVPAAHLSAARLSTLLDPATTELTPFLADGPPGSSGLMALEYVAHAALGELRHQALPVGLDGTVLSIGAEDHASFAPQATVSMGRALRAYPTIVAAELVAAVRALRMRPTRLPRGLQASWDQIDAILPRERQDRPLEDDLVAAAAILSELPATVSRR